MGKPTKREIEKYIKECTKTRQKCVEALDRPLTDKAEYQRLIAQYDEYIRTATEALESLN